jgi:hypothetical protein
MKTGTENRKKVMAAGGLGVLALLLVVYEFSQFFGGSTPAPVVTTPAAAQTIVTGGSTQVGASGSGPSGRSATIVRPREGAIPGGAAALVATSSAPLDPTLHMEAMQATEALVYTGNGRNIFSAVSAPVMASIPRPIASARTGPMAPVVQQPTGPPPPPPINLTFFGTETGADGRRKAFLLQGENVFIASAGEIVARRYRVVTINTNSVEVEDLGNANRQSLPLRAF